MSDSISIATACTEPETSDESELNKPGRWAELVFQILLKASIAIPGLLLGLIAGGVIGLWTGLIQFGC